VTRLYVQALNAPRSMFEALAEARAEDLKWARQANELILLEADCKAWEHADPDTPGLASLRKAHLQRLEAILSGRTT
jgi:hypothetical protein